MLVRNLVLAVALLRDARSVESGVRRGGVTNVRDVEGKQDGDLASTSQKVGRGCGILEGWVLDAIRGDSVELERRERRRGRGWVNELRAHAGLGCEENQRERLCREWFSGWCDVRGGRWGNGDCGGYRASKLAFRLKGEQSCTIVDILPHVLLYKLDDSQRQIPCTWLELLPHIWVRLRGPTSAPASASSLV